MGAKKINLQSLVLYHSTIPADLSSTRMYEYSKQSRGIVEVGTILPKLTDQPKRRRERIKEQMFRKICPNDTTLLYTLCSPHPSQLQLSPMRIKSKKKHSFSFIAHHHSAAAAAAATSPYEYEYYGTYDTTSIVQ